MERLGRWKGRCYTPGLLNTHYASATRSPNQQREQQQIALTLAAPVCGEAVRVCCEVISTDWHGRWQAQMCYIEVGAQTHWGSQNRSESIKSDQNQSKAIRIGRSLKIERK